MQEQNCRERLQQISNLFDEDKDREAFSKVRLLLVQTNNYDRNQKCFVITSLARLFYENDLHYEAFDLVTKSILQFVPGLVVRGDYLKWGVELAIYLGDYEKAEQYAEELFREEGYWRQGHFFTGIAYLNQWSKMEEGLACMKAVLTLPENQNKVDYIIHYGATLLYHVQRKSSILQLVLFLFINAIRLLTPEGIDMVYFSARFGGIGDEPAERVRDKLIFSLRGIVKTIEHAMITREFSDLQMLFEVSQVLCEYMLVHSKRRKQILKDLFEDVLKMLSNTSLQRYPREDQQNIRDGNRMR